MTLPELCEPFFQYVCRLTRSARKDAHLEASRIHSEVTAQLADMKSKAATDPNLVAQYEKIELPLIFFVDFMIKESRLSCAREWKELAYERNELAGDEKFFDLLDQTLAESSAAANERLAVFYTCMGLGFSGWYAGQPEYLRKKMLEVSGRIHSYMDADEQARICPEAYLNANTSDLVQPPSRKLVGIVLALVGMIVVLFVANVYLFKGTVDDLNKAMDRIIARGATASVQAPNGEAK